MASVAAKVDGLEPERHTVDGGRLIPAGERAA